MTRTTDLTIVIASDGDEPSVTLDLTGIKGYHLIAESGVLEVQTAYGRTLYAPGRWLEVVDLD